MTQPDIFQTELKTAKRIKFITQENHIPELAKCEIVLDKTSHIIVRLLPK
jgi:hypothetical protein